MKKQFRIAPQSIRVEAGVRAEIQCSSPLGVPQPKIQWLKNGAPLTQDSSIMVSADGNILVTRAELKVWVDISFFIVF